MLRPPQEASSVICVTEAEVGGRKEADVALNRTP